MAVNSFFHTSNVAALQTEKNLYSDLIAEAIQIYGHDVYYLDRTLVAEDTVFKLDDLVPNMQISTGKKYSAVIKSFEAGRRE